MISVIIITYKRTYYIRRAIESVLNQTYQNFELIVVDDNNPNTIYRDNLEKIMNSYKNNSKIKYIQHEYNKNGAAARNTGILASNGKYIAFLDDDDYFLPNRLEELSSILDHNKDYNGAYSSVIIENNKKIIGLTEAKKSGNLKNELLLDYFSFGTGSNLFFRAETVKKLKGFNVTFKRHQDIEFMLRFFKDNQILAVYTPSVVKVQDDRTNEPTIEQYIEIKNHYINIFEQDISILDDKLKNTFYKTKYKQLLEASIRKKEYKKFFELNRLYKKYNIINIKVFIRFLLLFLNNYFKFEKIKYFFIRRKVLFLFKQEVKDMKTIENYKCWKLERGK